MKKAQTGFGAMLHGMWPPENSHQVTGYPAWQPWYVTHGLGDTGAVCIVQPFFVTK